MGTIAEKLTYLNDTKTAIKNAVVAKGVSVSDTDTFRSYADKIGQISGGSAPVTKYGVSIDNLLGNVDADGNYVKPTEPFVLNLSGVKSMPSYGMCYFAAGGNITETRVPVRSLIANDLVSVTSQSFNNFAPENINFERVEMNNLELASGPGIFQNAFKSAAVASFQKLRKASGNYVFGAAFSGSRLDLSQVFPALE